MVVAIVFLGIVGGVINNLIKYRGQKLERRDDLVSEADELREQIRSLQDRIQVLERIVTDTSSREDLRRQFRDLEH
jgi:hypothetical protein